MRELQNIVQRLPNYHGSYVNDLSCLIPDDEYYFGINTPLLKEIKQRYDPENFFHRPPCKL